MLTYINGPNPWPEFDPGSTFELNFKTIIIIIFVFMLTRVNDQPNSWHKHGPNSTTELDFKIMIIIFFIFILTQVNDEPGRPVYVREREKERERSFVKTAFTRQTTTYLIINVGDTGTKKTSSLYCALFLPCDSLWLEIPSNKFSNLLALMV